MLVLFDNGTPRTPARFPIDRHMVTEARARGWEELENGELLKGAEAAGFEAPCARDWLEEATWRAVDATRAAPSERLVTALTRVRLMPRTVKTARMAIAS